MTYAIVPPQVDRSQPAHRQPAAFLYPGVVREADGGIVVRGAQAIATSAVLADSLFLSYITPLVAGDDDYAISVVTPMNAEGLRLYPRRPFASMATSFYDYPLSSRFDEVDATVVLDDVFVSWEHVFIDRNVELVNAQFRPGPHFIYAGMSLQRRLIVDLMRSLRELAGGAFQAMPPSEASFTSTETRADTERYYRSGVATARARVKLVKLIWDFVGTEFGEAATAMVDRCLGEY